jgi:hypothetical protein
MTNPDSNPALSDTMGRADEFVVVNHNRADVALAVKN